MHASLAALRQHAAGMLAEPLHKAARLRVAGQQIAGTQVVRNRFGHELDDGIPHTVPEVVIDAFEVIDVYHHADEVRFPALCGGVERIELFVECAPIEAAAEWVPRGEKFKLLGFFVDRSL